MSSQANRAQGGRPPRGFPRGRGDAQGPGPQWPGPQWPGHQWPAPQGGGGRSRPRSGNPRERGPVLPPPLSFKFEGCAQDGCGINCGGFLFCRSHINEDNLSRFPLCKRCRVPKVAKSQSYQLCLPCQQGTEKCGQCLRHLEGGKCPRCAAFKQQKKAEEVLSSRVEEMLSSRMKEEQEEMASRLEAIRLQQDQQAKLLAEKERQLAQQMDLLEEKQMQNEKAMEEKERQILQQFAHVNEDVEAVRREQCRMGKDIAMGKKALQHLLREIQAQGGEPKPLALSDDNLGAAIRLIERVKKLHVIKESPGVKVGFLRDIIGNLQKRFPGAADGIIITIGTAEGGAEGNDDRTLAVCGPRVGKQILLSDKDSLRKLLEFLRKYPELLGCVTVS